MLSKLAMKVVVQNDRDLVDLTLLYPRTLQSTTAGYRTQSAVWNGRCLIHIILLLCRLHDKGDAVFPSYF
jgi:hypothetical protein